MSDMWERPKDEDGSRAWRLVAWAALLGVLGMLALLPVQFATLPLNLAPVDFWSLLFLPVFGLFVLRRRTILRLPYLIPIWLILLGSFLGTLAAPDPLHSSISIAKDLSLYFQFVVLTAVLSSLSPRELRLALVAWLGVAVLHGLLVIAQFVSSDFYAQMSAYAARYGSLDQFRASGLFDNANGTGLYQLIGFVPLVLVRPNQLLGAALAVVLLLSIVGTGSLGAALGLAVGLCVALVALSLAGKRLWSLLGSVGQVVLVLVLLGALVYHFEGPNGDLATRVQTLTYGRAQSSAEGRFAIWDRGLGLFTSDLPITGLGPDSYRSTDLRQKQLHNDLLAFLIERGVTGALGLILLFATLLAKSCRLLLTCRDSTSPAALGAAVFVAALLGASVDAQFHQIFHERIFWFVLAIQEALLLRASSFFGVGVPQAEVSAPSSAPAVGAAPRRVPEGG